MTLYYKQETSSGRVETFYYLLPDECAEVARENGLKKASTYDSRKIKRNADSLAYAKRNGEILVLS